MQASIGEAAERGRLVGSKREFGGLIIDAGERTVLRDGNAVNLTPLEWLLLDALVAARGEVVGPEVLLTSSLGPAYARDEAYLAVLVWHLRNKLEDDPSRPQVLRSSQGGYYVPDGDSRWMGVQGSSGMSGTAGESSTL